MHRSEVNVELRKMDSRSPSRAEPDVSYAEINFKIRSAPRVRTDRGGLNSTYIELNFWKEDPRIDEDEEPPISCEPGGVTTTAQTGTQKQEPKQNIRDRKICLLYIVTFGIVAIVAGLSIYVSQIRQSEISSDRNSTVESKLSALNSNLSNLQQAHSDLRHQFNEIEAQYKSVSETKAQICDFWTSRTEQTCPGDWVTNEDRCYYVSTFETSFPRAMQKCSNRDSLLLEINSKDEASLVTRSLVTRNLAYWIGQCTNGNDAHGLLYDVSSGSECSECRANAWSDYCLHDKHRFICEKPAPCCPDIPAKIRLLCQQTGEPT